MNTKGDGMEKKLLELVDAYAAAVFAYGGEMSEANQIKAAGHRAALLARLAPPLVWTKEKPKVDGWYCWRAPGQKAWAIADVRMFTGAPCWHSMERAAWVAVWPDMDWAGPIPSPVEGV